MEINSMPQDLDENSIIIYRVFSNNGLTNAILHVELLTLAKLSDIDLTDSYR